MLLPIDPNDVVIDVASERSVFPQMVRATIGARVLRQDMIYTPGIHGDVIGGSADALDVPAEFADKLYLHNSFEHFEAGADTGFVREAWRILKPGGVVCVVPLYLSTRHQIITDPFVDRRGVVFDPDAEIVEQSGHHNRFARCYGVPQFAERVLRPAVEVGFDARIYHPRGADPERNDPFDRALRGIGFALVLRKPQTESASPAPSITAG